MYIQTPAAISYWLWIQRSWHARMDLTDATLYWLDAETVSEIVTVDVTGFSASVCRAEKPFASL
jgi:hypothetical protein